MNNTIIPLTLAAIAHEASCCLKTLYRSVKSGKLQTIRIGATIAVMPDVAERFVADYKSSRQAFGHGTNQP